MSAGQPEPGNEPDEEEWLSREELVEKEHQVRLRESEELQRRIDECCREAEAKWRAAHPWLDVPGMCITVPVRRLVLPDEGAY